MVDLGQFLEWLIVASAFVGIPLLLTTSPSRRRDLGDRAQRLGAWALRRLRTDEASDGIDNELAEALRHERLRQDLHRLQLLTLTDASMSATRQLANRLAYDKLRQDLTRSSHPAQLTATVGTAYATRRAASPDRVDVVSSRHRYQEPGAEVIEISWRSGSVARDQGRRV